LQRFALGQAAWPQIGRTGRRSNLTLVTYLRSDPSTLAARQPAPFAGSRKRRQPWPTQARWSRSPDRRPTWASATEGARASVTRRGARGFPGAPSAPPGPTCPSLGDARPMLPGEAIRRAPSLHRGGRRQAHRPRFERGDAPARGTRRGSTEGMAPWRHLTAGIQSGRARPRTLAVSASAPDRQNSRGAETLIAGERGGALPVSNRWCKSPVRRQEILHGSTLTRAAGRQTRTEAGASRGGGFTARGRARASNMRCRDRSCSRKPREARVKVRRSGSRSRCAGALRRRRVNHAFAQQMGRRGLRSRVNLSDGIARCPPERARRRSD
jgi:hypothetical protein